jgi:D-alanyl-lipoteichoic acid acyltransferase DltB (MBOAT superfamily)
MLFNSYAFLFVFLPLALLAFYGLRRSGRLAASLVSLTLASLAFYAYWKPQDIFILLGSIGFNFLVSKGLETTAGGRRARLLLALGICGDLALLFYFKYFNFIAANLAAAGGMEYTARAIVMPIGISFFTFTQIAYLVDCYRSRTHERNIVNYALFVTIFPHLIAGPIIHHAQMRPQFDGIARGPIDPETIKMGVVLFVLGLAKKVLLADNLVVGADAVFNAADHGAALGTAGAWAGLVSYTLQIYFDFSGYCDMAIGLALLFGLRLPVNFDSPYKSRSIIEFWRRWHITLSVWLRDYLYIPLGGNRHGELMRLRNVFITMLLGGIWHGAGWTFVVWGALHGAYIVANHLLHLGKDPHRVAPADAPAVAAGKQAATLLLVMLAWVFFRAKSLPGALLLLQSLAGAAPPGTVVADIGPIAVFWILCGTAIVLFAPNTQQLVRYSARLSDPLRLAPGPIVPALRARPPALAATPALAIACGLLFAAAFGQLWRPAIFIYFNF